MEADLVAAEEACWDEALKPRRALALTRSLRRHEETLREASKHGARHQTNSKASKTATIEQARLTELTR
jgi:hypothetical protein